VRWSKPSVDQNDTNLPQTVVQELAQLRQQIQVRDKLVEQLSTELFRMVKTHPPALPASTGARSANASTQFFQTEDDGLREDLRRLEEQIEFYQGQIDKRDVEIARLQKSCQVLSERNQLLENIIQELPEIYKQKFVDRLDSVKSKVQSLQTENRRLNSALQQVNAQGLPEAGGAARNLALPAKRNTFNPSKLSDARPD
jgi:chromosome segregation ATPase